MGLPILDPIITLHGVLDRSAKKEMLFTRTDVRWDEQPIVWVVCLGMGTSVEGARMFNLFPQEGISYVYTLPDVLVNPDPYKTRKVHKECAEQILSDLRKLPDNIKVSVLSISAGNALGFYVANHYPAERFIAAVTGAGLGKELFWSLACMPIARKTLALGYKTGEEYDQPLLGSLPIDNVDHLPKNRHIFILDWPTHKYRFGLGSRFIVKLSAIIPMLNFHFFGSAMSGLCTCWDNFFTDVSNLLCMAMVLHGNMYNGG